MSRFNPQAPRPVIASKTTYDLLVVDSVEESEEEEPLSEAEREIHNGPTEPAKPTKSALKKAARLARIERKQQQRLLKSQSKSASSESLQVASAEPPVRDYQVQEEMVLISPAVVSDGRTKALPADERPEAKEVPSNGDVHPCQTTVETTSEQEEVEPLDSPLEQETIQHEIDVVPKKSAVEPQPPILDVAQEAEKVKKRQNALTRILWTFIMIFAFIGLLLLGHAYMVLLVMLCQTLVYREVTALFSLKTATPESDDYERLKGKDPWSKTLNWYFFAVTNYFLYGESIIYYFKHVVFADAQLLPFATNHRMISFTLYTIGFMGFVMSLKKGYLKQQFGLFCWVHMSLLLIVVSSHFIVNNILEGLIWFWVPASLVICNDCFAYIWGVTVGRTPLIKLSPKKTVEGFVGAFICTVIFAVLWGTYFMRFNYMICPVHDLGVSAWSSNPCKPNPVFVWKTLELWKPVSVLLTTLTGRAVHTVPYCPYHLHLLILACFASLVAPFGGFFASGFKRAFNIKDFGHSIPGHGGMTDRMDCQFLMGIFTYVYYSSLIRVNNITVGGIMQTIVSSLTIEQQLQLINDLTRYLEKQGIRVP